MSEKFTIDRRRFLTGLGALGTAGALTACVGPTITSRGSATAGSGAGASAALLGAVDAKPATGTVSFAHWRAEDKAVFDTLIATFVKANPQAKITQDISPSNDYQSTALQKIKGGNIGNAFTAFRGAQFVNMVKAGLYAGLGAQPFVDGYFAELIKAGQDPSRAQMGLPYQLVFNMPIYNEDAFAKAGVTSLPEDWDGFLALCEKLKGAGFVPIAWPGGEPANSGQLINCDGHEQHAHRHRVRRHRGRHAEGHRRLVPADPQAVPAAGAVLRAQLHRHRVGAAAADVRQRPGRHARHRLVPHQRGPQARREVPHQPHRPDHGDQGQGEVRGDLQRHLHPRRQHRRQGAGHRRQVARSSSPTRSTPRSTRTGRRSTSPSRTSTTPTPTSSTPRPGC